MHSSRRIVNLNYEVNILSLNDLLSLNDAPTEIDLISIDTEGSEIEILEQFDFQKYAVSIIIVEHNYDNKQKNKLKKLLKKIQINFNKNKRPRLLVYRSEYIAEK